MSALRVGVPPHVAEVIRHLPPGLKQSIKLAIRALAERPELGVGLLRELAGLSKYQVRRFRIVYEVDASQGCLRVVAVGHRRDVYDRLVTQRRR